MPLCSSFKKIWVGSFKTWTKKRGTTEKKKQLRKTFSCRTLGTPHSPSNTTYSVAIHRRKVFYPIDFTLDFIWSCPFPRVWSLWSAFSIWSPLFPSFSPISFADNDENCSFVVYTRDSSENGRGLLLLKLVLGVHLDNDGSASDLLLGWLLFVVVGLVSASLCRRTLLARRLWSGFWEGWNFRSGT